MSPKLFLPLRGFINFFYVFLISLKYLVKGTKFEAPLYVIFPFYFSHLKELALQ
jgi:hypothetical protein